MKWPFNDFQIPTGLQKRLVKFLLKRTLGRFLAEELQLSNFDVQLGSGLIELKDIALNLQLLNEIFPDFKITCGSVGLISLNAPWQSLLNGTWSLTFSKIRLSCELSYSDIPVSIESANLSASVYYDLSSSIHIADDFIHQEAAASEEILKSITAAANRLPLTEDSQDQGLQILAYIIEGILSRMKLCFQDCLISFVGAAHTLELIVGNGEMTTKETNAEQASNEQNLALLRCFRLCDCRADFGLNGALKIPILCIPEAIEVIMKSSRSYDIAIEKIIGALNSIQFWQFVSFCETGFRALLGSKSKDVENTFDLTCGVEIKLSILKLVFFLLLENSKHLNDIATDEENPAGGKISLEKIHLSLKCSELILNVEDCTASIDNSNVCYFPKPIDSNPNNLSLKYSSDSISLICNPLFFIVDPLRLDSMTPFLRSPQISQAKLNQNDNAFNMDETYGRIINDFNNHKNASSIHLNCLLPCLKILVKIPDIPLSENRNDQKQHFILTFDDLSIRTYFSGKSVDLFQVFMEHKSFTIDLQNEDEIIPILNVSGEGNIHPAIEIIKKKIIKIVSSSMAYSAPFYSIAFDGETIPQLPDMDESYKFKHETSQNSYLLINCNFPKGKLFLHEYMIPLVNAVANWSPAFLEIPIIESSNIQSDTFKLLEMSLREAMSEGENIFKTLSPTLFSLNIEFGALEASLTLSNEQNSSHNLVFSANSFSFFLAGNHNGKKRSLYCIDAETWSLSEDNICISEKSIKERSIRFSKTPLAAFSVICVLDYDDSDILQTFISLSISGNNFNLDFCPSLLEYISTSKSKSNNNDSINSVRAFISLNDCSLQLNKAQFIFHSENMKIILQNNKQLTIIGSNSSSYLIDDIKYVKSKEFKDINTKEYWCKKGYKDIFQSNYIKVSLRKDEVHIKNSHLVFRFCKDSFETFLNFVRKTISKTQKKNQKIIHQRTPESSIDDINEVVDKFIADDENIDSPMTKSVFVLNEDGLTIVEEFYNNSSSGKTTNECKIAGFTDDVHVKVVEGFSDVDIEDDYFPLYSESQDEVIKENIKLIIKASNVNINLKLESGRDWERVPSGGDSLELERSLSDAINPLSEENDELVFPMSPSKRTLQPNLDSLPSSPRSFVQEKEFVDFAVNNLEFSHIKFMEGAEFTSQTILKVFDVEILDFLQNSTWKKFLTTKTRDSQSSLKQAIPALIMEFSSFLSEGKLSSTQISEESKLKVIVSPLRFHVDQGTFSFIMDFFENAATVSQDETKRHDKSSEPFFQVVDIRGIDVKLDYKPRSTNLSQLFGGKFSELMNIFTLEDAELRLAPVKLRGVSGFGALGYELIQTWIPFIKSSQMGNLLGGFAPIRTAINVGNGIADLVLLPLNQYIKDGQVLRGLSKGSLSFAKAAALESLKIGTKLAGGTQGILEGADEFISGNEDGLRIHLQEQPHSKYSNPPTTLLEGLEEGYTCLNQNVSIAAHTIFAVPLQVYQKSGNGTGVARSVIKAVPIAILKPMIGASAALKKTLMGLHTTLDPKRKQEMQDKYK